jgi:hypothetical protein
MTNSQTFLTKETIARFAPAAFATAPATTVSDRYNLFPTSEVIDLMAGAGFGVTQAMQKRGAIEKRGVAKHLLRFRHEALKVGKGDDFLEIVLRNSHDGTSSYMLQLGVFRLVCSNGLIVASQMFDAMRVRHTATAREVFDASMQLTSNVQLLNGHIQEMQGRIMTGDEQLNFARQALAQRYGEDSKVWPVRPSKLLGARRSEDGNRFFSGEDRNLWVTFNVVQENMLKGGVRDIGLPTRVYGEDGGSKIVRRSVMPVTGVDALADLNTGLWSLAEKQLVTVS